MEIAVLCLSSLLIAAMCQNSKYTLTAEEKQIIVDLHNEARRNVVVTASNMEEMVSVLQWLTTFRGG